MLHSDQNYILSDVVEESVFPTIHSCDHLFMLHSDSLADSEQKYFCNTSLRRPLTFVHSLFREVYLW